MYPFKSPTTIIITGCSQSGKTTWLLNLLLRVGDMFPAEHTSAILYCYEEYQHDFDKIQQLISNISFKEGLPTKDDIDGLADNNGHCILVCDDLMEEAANNKLIQSLFVRKSHHCNISVIYLNQNYYAKGVSTTTINRNCHYLVLFEQPDIHPIAILDRQMELGGALVEAHKDATSKDFGYLVLDRSPRRIRLHQMRTKIFPGEETYVYRIK